MNKGAVHFLRALAMLLALTMGTMPAHCLAKARINDPPKNRDVLVLDTTYAVIDTGTAYRPLAIANNGMILGSGTQTHFDLSTDYPSAVTNVPYGTYLEGQDVEARWVSGNWHALTVPGSTQVQVNSMNNNGAVVGAAAFPNSSTPLSSDVRGVIWTNDPSQPQTQASDQTFTLTTNGTDQYTVASRTYNLATDGTAGDYSAGMIYGSEVTQVFGVNPTGCDIRGPTLDYRYDNSCYGNAASFSAVSGQMTALDNPIWTGTFYSATTWGGPQGETGTDIFGHQYQNEPESPAVLSGTYSTQENYPYLYLDSAGGQEYPFLDGYIDNLAFTGTSQVIEAANAHWIVSVANVWSFAVKSRTGHHSGPR